MTMTLEDSNVAMREAVRRRMETTPDDDPKKAGYKPPVLAGCKPAEECAARVLSDCCEGQRMRGPSAAEVLERFSPTPPRASLAWLDATNTLQQLHREKTAQYGGESDPFENVTASAKCGVEPWRRALCDLSDCVVRMQKFAQGQPVDWENALLDAANWALICYVKLKESHNP
jgi:hypothetical protein